MKKVTNLISLLFVVFSTFVLSLEKNKINLETGVNRFKTNIFIYEKDIYSFQNCQAMTISAIS